MSKDFYFQAGDGNEKRTKLLNYLASAVARVSNLDSDTVLKGVVLLDDNGNSGIVQGDVYNTIIEEGKPPLSENEGDDVFGYSYRVINIPSVFSSITGNLKEIYLDSRVVWDGGRWVTKTNTTGGQFHDSGTSIGRAVPFTAQESGVEQIVIKTGTNGYTVDSFTLEDGATLTIEDGATYTIL